MPYTPDTWETGNPLTPLSGPRMTKVASQYPQVMADLPAKIADAGDPIGAALSSAFAGVGDVYSKTVADGRFERRWIVTSEAQIAPTLSAIALTGGGAIVIPESVSFSTTADIDLSTPAVTALHCNGTLTLANDTTIKREGGYAGTGKFANITANVTAGSRVITVNSTTNIAVNDWVLVASTDTIRSSTDKRGYMRQIVSISGLTVTLDEGIPRGLTSANTARAYKVNLAPTFTLGGTGTIRYADQEGATPMLRFKWMQNLTITQTITLENGGGPCVALQHVVGFDVRATIRKFRNDVGGGHVGYGVMAGGACRDGFVGGIISYVRHAFTTVTGPDNSAGTNIQAYTGEPENIIVRPVTFRCGDKALDTHVPGWGIYMFLRDVGSGGGFHVRSDNTVIEGSGDGLTGPLVQIDNEGGAFVVPPIIKSINGTNISLSAGSGALSFAANAVMQSFPEVYNVTGSPLWKIDAGVSVTVPPKVSTFFKTAQQTIISQATLQDVTELQAPVVSGGEYFFKAYSPISSSTTADAVIAWASPSGTTLEWVPNGPAVTVSSTSASVARQHVVNDGSTATNTSTANIGGNGVSVNLVTVSEGHFVAGGDGTFGLQFAQLVSEATNTTIRAGAWLELRRIR